MKDRRVFRSNGRVAHSSLRGQVEGVSFVDGAARRVVVPVADVLAAPGGALERQLLMGDGFCVLEKADGFVFGFAVPSGYVGYLTEHSLGDGAAPSHRVCTMGAHIYGSRSIKQIPLRYLPFGAGVLASDRKDGFWAVGSGFIPEQQLIESGEVHLDAAATALQFLGVPYLWGGDSNLGIDCSGLVHVALRLAGKDCPRDSDQQQAFFAPVAAGEALVRGDLVFWKGHVAMMLDGATLVHANGHHMCVTVEDLGEVSRRIEAAGGGQVTGRARP